MHRIIARYLVNILLSIDQFGNALLAGDPDETISSRLGKLKQRHNGRIPWRRPISKIVDAALDRIDPNHSLDAIEPDEGARAILDRSPSPGDLASPETKTPLPSDPSNKSDPSAPSIISRRKTKKKSHSPL